MTDYYKSKYQQGQEYQDFIADQLRKHDPCIIVSAYSSRKYQMEHGESSCGIEIKLDMRIKDTGNLYFEVAEKSNPSLLDYSPSGIMRDDNTWLYLIGDYDHAWIFSKNQLKQIYKCRDSWKRRGIIERKTETSIGFTYPVESAEKGMCLYKFTFGDENDGK